MDKKPKIKFSLAHLYIILFAALGLFSLANIAFNLAITARDILFARFAPASEITVKYTGLDYVCDEPADPALGAREESDKSNSGGSAISGLFSWLDDYITSKDPATDQLVVLGAKCKQIAGLSAEFAFTDNPIVVQMANGWLAYVADYCDNTREINSVIAFSDYLKKQDCDFLYIEHMAKFNKSLYNGFYKDYTEEMSKEIVESLEAAGISVLNINEEREKANLDHDSMFFATDHHWLPSAGIWASGVLSRRLNEEFGYNIDTSLFDESSYTVEILKNSSLGSQGKKLTTVYTQPEDFPVVLPKYDTDLTVFHSFNSTTISGSIQETLLNTQAIQPETLKKLTQNSTYTFYGYGDQPLIQVHNNKLSDGKRVLILKNSFANVMYPFLAAGVEYLDILDLRHFQGSLRAYIQKTKPDTVVLAYGASYFSRKAEYYDAFDFN